MRVLSVLATLAPLTASVAGLNFPAGPARLVVTPGDILIAPSSQQQFKATLSYLGGFGNAAAQRDVSAAVRWSSSDQTIASVDSNGVVTSTTQPGTAFITAAAGPWHTTVPLTVSTATLSSILVTPASASLPLGRKQQLAAIGNYSDNSQHDLTTAAAWSSDAGSVASVDVYGQVATHKKGAANITASFGQQSGASALTVTDPVVDSIVVTPADPVITYPPTLQMAATAIYSDFTSQDLTSSVSWVSSDLAAAVVAPTGVVTSKDLGVTTVTASFSTASGATQVTVAALPIGAVTSASAIACPAVGLTGTCYSLNVSCPSVADQNVLVKVIPASGTPRGTVVFMGGGGSGGGFFDYPQSAGGYPYGQYIISSVTQNGFTVASLDFNDPIMGWLTGPGGMRRLACRPATTIQWVYQNVHQASPAAPMCGAAVSGGSTALAESLSHYGLAPLLAMIEATGGPPLTRMDHGCLCDQPPNLAGPCNGPLITNCYASDVLPIVDATYAAPICTDTNAGDTSNLSLLLHDSVLDGPDALFNFPKTDVHVVLGGKDDTTAVPEGVQWAQSIITTKTLACVATGGHAFPNFLSGADQIISYLNAFCRLQ